jgi:hypothetical protein
VVTTRSARGRSRNELCIPLALNLHKPTDGEQLAPNGPWVRHDEERMSTVRRFVCERYPGSFGRLKIGETGNVGPTNVPVTEGCAVEVSGGLAETPCEMEVDEEIGDEATLIGLPCCPE